MGRKMGRRCKRVELSSNTLRGAAWCCLKWFTRIWLVAWSPKSGDTLQPDLTFSKICTLSLLRWCTVIQSLTQHSFLAVMCNVVGTAPCPIWSTEKPGSEKETTYLLISAAGVCPKLLCQANPH